MTGDPKLTAAIAKSEPAGNIPAPPNPDDEHAKRIFNKENEVDKDRARAGYRLFIATILGFAGLVATSACQTVTSWVELTHRAALATAGASIGIAMLRVAERLVTPVAMQMRLMEKQAEANVKASDPERLLRRVETLLKALRPPRP